MGAGVHGVDVSPGIYNVCACHVARKSEEESDILILIYYFPRNYMHTTQVGHHLVRVPYVFNI
jgi:hypothetical protein